MKKGVFGFSIGFYGILGLLLAVCHQYLLLGGLLLFAFWVERDEWLNRQLMQAMLLALSYLLVTIPAHIASSVLIVVPLLGRGLIGMFTGIVDVVMQLLIIVFALRAGDRMNKGLDSDIPFISGFVNSMF